MGGSSYGGNVSSRSRSSSNFNYRGYGVSAESASDPERRECHPDLNPKNRVVECSDSTEHPKTTPIVVAMDVTRSRGDDAKVIYGKLPMFIGQIIMKNYVSDPTISFCAIGDATSGDHAPLQVGQFKSDNCLDDILSKIWLEEGGGGTGQESYELASYYYAKKSKLDCLKRGKKGFFFFLGDESFYPTIANDQVKIWIGDNIKESLTSQEVFQELQLKYQVFFVYPQKTWGERKSDIDAEIKKRVKEAGGMYENVDFRASLIWNTFDDLDLHVIVTPDSGCGKSEHIAYNNRQSQNGQGELDIDRNAGCRETREPVENIRWVAGTAVKGKYQVFVRNYLLHDDNSYRKFPIPIKVEVEIHGKIKSFKARMTQSTVSEGYEQKPTGSDIVIGEFYFDPDQRAKESDLYTEYQDEVIKRQWASVIPSENILIIDDPHAIIDVMLGAIAITEGSIDLDQYLVDMSGRGQTQLRLDQTSKALGGLIGESALVKVETSGLPSRDSGKTRKGRTVRL